MVIANYVGSGAVNKFGQGAPLGETFVEATNKYGADLDAGSVVAFRYDSDGNLEAFKDASGLASVPRTVGVAVGSKANSDGSFSDKVLEDEIGIFQISGFCKKVITDTTTGTNKNLDVIKDTHKADVSSTRGTATFGFAVGEETAVDDDFVVAAQLYGLPVITAAA